MLGTFFGMRLASTPLCRPGTTGWPVCQLGSVRFCVVAVEFHSPRAVLGRRRPLCFRCRFRLKSGLHLVVGHGSGGLGGVPS